MSQQHSAATPQPHQGPQMVEPADKENHQTKKAYCYKKHRGDGIDTATHPISPGKTAEEQGVPQDEVKKVRLGPNGGNTTVAASNTTVATSTFSTSPRTHQPLTHAGLSSSCPSTHHRLVLHHQELAHVEAILHGDDGKVNEEEVVQGGHRGGVVNRREAIQIKALQCHLEELSNQNDQLVCENASWKPECANLSRSWIRSLWPRRSFTAKSSS